MRYKPLFSGNGFNTVYGYKRVLVMRARIQVRVCFRHNSLSTANFLKRVNCSCLFDSKADSDDVL